jgi:hypothetical protein
MNAIFSYFFTAKICRGNSINNRENFSAEQISWQGFWFWFPEEKVFFRVLARFSLAS